MSLLSVAWAQVQLGTYQSNRERWVETVCQPYLSVIVPTGVLLSEPLLYTCIRLEY